MALHVERTAIPDVTVVSPTVFDDPRGFFMETFHAEKYRQAGIDRTFVQDNCSRSCQGTLRGLHFQLRHPQAKLVSVTWGTVFDVAVDIRVGSPTFGRWVGQMLSDANRKQMFVPEGFAHGFCVVSARADVLYKCSDYYDPGDDGGLLWRDTDVGIEWPVGEPLVSEKDRNYPRLRDLPADRLPAFSRPN